MYIIAIRLAYYMMHKSKVVTAHYRPIFVY